MFNLIALMQWELGKVITNPLLVKGDRVIFRSATGAVYTMLSGVGTVAVPNALLQYAVPFVVERDGHPEERTKFTVTAQPKPSGYVFENNVPDICGVGIDDLDAELRDMLSGGGSGGSGGGKELIITVNDPNFGMDRWNMIGAEANMSWVDAKAAVLDGSLTKVSVLEYPGDEYGARTHNADIRVASLDDGMSFKLCIDYLDVQHSGGSSINVSNRSIIWSESGSMTGNEKQII